MDIKACDLTSAVALSNCLGSSVLSFRQNPLKKHVSLQLLMCLKQQTHKQKRYPISSRILTPFQRVHTVFLKTPSSKKQKTSITMFISKCISYDFSIESLFYFFSFLSNAVFICYQDISSFLSIISKHTICTY